MANALKDLSAALRGVIQRASAFTVGLERESYDVSGVLIGGDRVLTASHLVPDEGITVAMPDGTKKDAKLAGRDPIHDLALLRLGSDVKAGDVPTAPVAVGDMVVSLKRDSFDGINASLAMVSSAGAKLRIGRSGVLERYFQTDADRLTGTTGGPLVDADGAFAGIQVFNRRMGAEVSIPSDLALARARILEEKGSVPRPYLGVRSQEVPLTKAVKELLKARQDTGLLLVFVESGSAAERAGLEVGDILVGIAGVAVADHEQLVTAISEHGAGSKIEMQVVRGGALRSVSVTIGSA
ncbi:MAG: trypsin-like peptidase domain-containing protein [Spirochaetia bacterium]|jgi:S1-C subfamily serine protease